MKNDSSDGWDMEQMKYSLYVALLVFRNLWHRQRTLQNTGKNHVFGELKGEGHSKELTFFLHVWQVNSGLLRSPKFQPLKPKIRLERLPFWNCIWQPGRIYVTSFRPTRNLQEAEKPATNLASFTRSAKYFFFNRLSPSPSLLLSFSGFGESFAQNSTAQGQPWPRVVIKRLVGSHQDKIPWTEWRHENLAWLLSTVQNGGNDVGFWASLETNFIRKTWNLQVETSMSG